MLKNMDTQVAVKAVIVNRQGKYLIVREGDRWQAVGGRLDKGEKLEVGLRREVQEETGITQLEVGTVIHVDEWFAKPEGELKHIVALFFLCRVDVANVLLSGEHAEYAWVTAEELEDYGEMLEKEIREAIILASMRS